MSRDLKKAIQQLLFNNSTASGSCREALAQKIVDVFENTVVVHQKDDVRIAGKSLAEWHEFAKRDDCLDLMVPSDLRQLLSLSN